MAIYEVKEEDVVCLRCNGTGILKKTIQVEFTPEEEAAAKDAISKLPSKESLIEP